MHKFLILLTALTGITAAAPMIAQAAPLETHFGAFRGMSAPAAQPVDYYWNHHHWHHGDWDRDHHHWHYYN
jgi:hypothetical protein